MGRKTYRPEQIIGKLWEAEVLLSQDGSLSTNSMVLTSLCVQVPGLEPTE